MLGLNESYVVYDKNAGLADLCQFLNGTLGCLYAVVASVECPRTAKDAIPRAAPAKLDGCGRVQLADEILVTMLNQVAGWRQIVERLHERRRRAAMVECYAAGNVFQVRPTLSESIQQPGNRRLTFAGQHAIHSAAGVPQNFFWNKRNTVSTNTDECLRR